MTEESILEYPWVEELRKLADQHWKKYLPKMYQELKKEGTLEKMLDNAAINTAEAQIQTEMQLLQQNPPPKDFLERVRHRNWAKQTSWEIVREMWILLPAEENKDP